MTHDSKTALHFILSPVDRRALLLFFYIFDNIPGTGLVQKPSSMITFTNTVADWVPASSVEPENSVSRDRFGRPVPRQPAPISPYSGYL